MIELAQGRLSVQSRHNYGTVFTIDFARLYNLKRCLGWSLLLSPFGPAGSIFGLRIMSLRLFRTPGMVFDDDAQYLQTLAWVPPAQWHSGSFFAHRRLPAIFTRANARTEARAWAQQRHG